ncbi:MULTISPECIES: glycoside hydrolase family 97 protein [unclassified Lentimonas]|uniref:glycoside hydrolase family 97 protein n=1 Tax=unclassified Lentimonas TaxID=2630993 RepID=UPI001FD24582|nr:MULTISPECIES: glycoside hydrolase family 97 protein [unclassified Lentimonas]
MAAPTVVSSPNGDVSASFEITNGTLMYAVSKDGIPIVEPSKIQIFGGAKMAMMDHSVRENDTSWEPVVGQFSSIRDHHVELTLSLIADDLPLTLLCRVFDTGIGFRFVLPEASKGRELTFSNEYKILDAAANYRGERGLDFTNKRAEWTAFSREKRAKLGKKAKDPEYLSKESYLRFGEVPVVTERTDGLHTAFLESDLYSAAPFELMRVEMDAEGQFFKAYSSAISSGEGQVTAWRAILIGETAGDLILNTVVLNLAAPSKIEETAWIHPGKGLWDWRVHGYNNGDFKYGINTQSCLRFIDFCAEHGLDYFTLDDHWFNKAKDGNMLVNPNIDIQKIISYAEEKGVMIMLYYDRRRGDFGDEKLFNHYAELGATGVKYGFMGNNAQFTRSAMDKAAESQQLINFHDNPVPMAGVDRTLPNLITREYCHGQQDARTAFTPETFLRMAFVASLSGPLDMSNGNFGLIGINAGERDKGPRIQGSYISTVVSEVARCVVIYTGLITLPDAPEEYAKKPDLFEFLKALPVTWDNTLIINSKIGEYITTARRRGDTWFVGSVNNQIPRTLDVPLDFLEAGKSYEVTLYQDTPETHGVNNPEVYEIKKQMVHRGDVITANMALGGGHAMILKPVE